MSPLSRGGERGRATEGVITIFLCVSIMVLLSLFVFCAYRRAERALVGYVEISRCLTLSHTQTHRQFYFLQLHVWYSAFALFMKNLQSAADKTVGDSMLESVFPMPLCASGHVLNMCSTPASAAALQALGKRSVAYTHYITNGINSTIAHLTGNNLWMLWPRFLYYFKAVQEFKDQGQLLKCVSAWSAYILSPFIALTLQHWQTIIYSTCLPWRCRSTELESCGIVLTAVVGQLYVCLPVSLGTQILPSCFRQ